MEKKKNKQPKAVANGDAAEDDSSEDDSDLDDLEAALDGKKQLTVDKRFKIAIEFS